MIITFDTETYKYNEEKKIYEPILDAREFVIGCVKTDTGITKFFKDRKEMFNWIIEMIEKNAKKKRRTYIYAHNTQYDWYAIAKEHFLDDRMNYILFHPFLGIWDNKGYFLDSMAFFKMGLGKLGDMLGFKKLVMPKEIKEIDELKEYVERDTDIVLKAILSLKEKLSIFGFTPRKLLTAGQLSMTCFMTFCRKNYTAKHFTEYNPEKKRYEIVKSKYPALIREAYRGGDNQAHKVGKFENVTLLDINGLYADNMTKMRFPDLKSENLQVKPPLNMFKKYLEKQIGVARVKIKAPITEHPVLPVRFSDYQVFPSNTTMRGTWTFIEINQALKEGYIIEEVEWCIRWNELIVDKKPFNPLKKFIETLYPLEKEAKTKEEKIPIKLIRNNLSGKFAQYKKNKITKVVPRSEVMEYIEDGFCTKSKFEDKYIIIKETDNYDPSYTNPIISILITAIGRLRIHEEEKKIPIERRLYKDTDSLMFVDDEIGTIRKRFNISESLGDWKIESVNESAKILGEKRYYIGDNVKISGIHSKNRTKKVIDEEKNIKITKMFGINSAIQSGKWNKVGSLDEVELEMKPHNKNMLPIPSYIDEVKIELKENGKN